MFTPGGLIGKTPAKNNRGWRIDHICLTPKLVGKLKSVDILMNQYGSDHCPVKIQIS